MKSRILVFAAATAFAFASATLAQQVQAQPEERSAPQSQQASDQPEIPTRTAAPTSRQGELPSTTTYTSPPAAPVAEQPAPVEVPVAEAPAPVPAPAPVVAETNTTTTTYEELPGSASPFPSVGLGGLALLTAGILMRRKADRVAGQVFTDRTRPE